MASVEVQDGLGSWYDPTTWLPGGESAEDKMKAKIAGSGLLSVKGPAPGDKDWSLSKAEKAAVNEYKAAGAPLPDIYKKKVDEAIAKAKKTPAKSGGSGGKKIKISAPEPAVYIPPPPPVPQLSIVSWKKIGIYGGGAAVVVAALGKVGVVHIGTAPVAPISSLPAPPTANSPITLSIDPGIFATISRTLGQSEGPPIFGPVMG